MRRVLFAVAALPAAFAVADVTDWRPLGAAVLAVLAALAMRSAPRGRAFAWFAVLLACFAVSHALADPLGTWGAIAVVTGVTGLAGWLLLAGDASSPGAPGR